MWNLVQICLDRWQRRQRCIGPWRSVGLFMGLRNFGIVFGSGEFLLLCLQAVHSVAGLHGACMVRMNFHQAQTHIIICEKLYIYFLGTIRYLYVPLSKTHHRSRIGVLLFCLNTTNQQAGFRFPARSKPPQLTDLLRPAVTCVKKEAAYRCLTQSYET